MGCPAQAALGVKRTIPGFYIPEQYLLISCLYQKELAIIDFAY
jgi:hypothetical protein